VAGRLKLLRVDECRISRLDTPFLRVLIIRMLETIVRDGLVTESIKWLVSPSRISLCLNGTQSTVAWAVRPVSSASAASRRKEACTSRDKYRGTCYSSQMLRCIDLGTFHSLDSLTASAVNYIRSSNHKFVEQNVPIPNFHAKRIMRIYAP
jgi:hypothetical protein